MPRNTRCVEEKLVYHVTQRGINHESVFFSRGDRRTYLTLAAANVADCEVRIFAWCLMSNHVHWVLEAGRKNSLAVFFRRVHGRYAQYLNARCDRVGHLWQNRFYSCPLSPGHLVRSVRYVEENPVRAGIVDSSELYRWSSAAAHLKGPGAERIPLLDWGFWREIGGADGWRQHISRTEDIRQIRDLRECTHSGKPYGDDAFVQEMEARFGRQWRPVGRQVERKPAKREMGTEQSASPALLSNATGSG
jgi:putative transposase